MPDWIGKTIGRVRIDKYLAHGGMAEVYLGTHLTLDRPVAVKVLHGFIEEIPDLITRFQREARVVAGLRHSNIVQIFDFDTVDNHPYIVMEYLSGPSLASYLRNLHSRNERMPSHQVARLLKGLTAALDYAHTQGVIHRDIKPGNILLHSKTEETALNMPLPRDVDGILTDFGLVRIANTASQTASGTVSGTPSYMSPEQARGDKTDQRTDIYSLGIVLYEMLAGRVPFEADTSLSIIYMQINEPPPPIPGISPAVQAVLDRALKKNPLDRYASSREMAVDFFRAIGMTAEAETIVVETLPESISKSTESLRATSIVPPHATAEKEQATQRRPLWIGAGIIGLIVLVGLALGAMRLFSSSANPTSDPNTTATVPTTDTAATQPSGALPSADGMVEVAANSYEVGTTSLTDEYHTAPFNVTLDSYWIDKYQVTNAQYEQYLNATRSQQPEIWPGEANHPVRGVTWDQAVAYCGWVNKRLPTEAEWEAAGRGAGAGPQLYPWGTDPTAGGNTNSLPDQDTYPVGTLAFNQSPLGVFDLVGNVWEWTGEPYNQVQDGYEVLRGGRYGLLLDLAYRLAVPKDDARYVKYAGFRCAADQVQ
jgi:eukaryotic-like serine/threonine-protein kinase